MFLRHSGKDTLDQNCCKHLQVSCVYVYLLKLFRKNLLARNRKCKKAFSNFWDNFSIPNLKETDLSSSLVSKIFTTRCFLCYVHVQVINNTRMYWYVIYLLIIPLNHTWTYALRHKRCFYRCFNSSFNLIFWKHCKSFSSRLLFAYVTTFVCMCDYNGNEQHHSHCWTRLCKLCGDSMEIRIL